MRPGPNRVNLVLNLVKSECLHAWLAAAITNVSRYPYNTQNNKFYENIINYTSLFHDSTVNISLGTSRSEVLFKL